ncbi:spore cortex biosynthesis protein YabQ [Phosphitispora sp. TUW77]|uniref:spore cortex biosynthesis protein YabQ n=1 Tax=Phosphitispora sp. TUW77 TaxID=3152361 RepID=UPI003AB30CB4
MQSLESQLFSFMVTLLMGVTIGILFDFYNVTKGIIRPRKLGTYLGDILFWVITTIVVFFMLLIGNWGELRFYVVIGILTGILCYIKLFSRLVTRTLLFIINIIKKTIASIVKGVRFLWFVVSYPFVLLGNIIIIPIGFLGRTYNKLFGFAGRQVEKLMKKLNSLFNKKR